MRRAWLIVPLLLMLAAPAIAGGPWFARGRTVSTRPLPVWSSASVPLAVLVPTGARADTSVDKVVSTPSGFTLYAHPAPPDSMKDGSDSTYSFISTISTGVIAGASIRHAFHMSTCPTLTDIDSVVVAYRIKQWMTSGTIQWSVVRAFIGGVLLSTAYQANAPTNGSYQWVYVTVPSALVNSSWAAWTTDRINQSHWGLMLGTSTLGAATMQLRCSEMRVLVYGPPPNEAQGRMNVPVATVPEPDVSTDELKDTYLVAAAATRADTLLDESCTASDEGTQTNAGTHDSTATTQNRLHFVGAASETMTPWSGSLSVDWTALERVGTYAGTISYVRLIYTLKANYLTGREGFMSELDNGYYLQPRWGGISQPPQAISLYPGNPVREAYVDYALDDLGEAWTHTKLTSQQFGFLLGGFGANDAEEIYPDLDCEEFRVEVYGPK